MSQLTSALASIFGFFISCFFFTFCMFLNLFAFSAFVGSPGDTGFNFFGLAIYFFFFLGLIIFLGICLNYLYKSYKHLTQEVFTKTIKVIKRGEKGKLFNLLFFGTDYFLFRELGLIDLYMRDENMEYILNPKQYEEIREGDTLEIEYFSYSKRVIFFKRIQ